MNVQPGSDECGSVLVIVLVFVAALFLLGSALLIMTVTENIIAYNHERDIKLYYITEAGIEAAVAALNSCCDCDGPVCGSLGGGSYYAEIVDEPGLGEEHPYFERLPLQLAEGERLVISTGELEESSLVLAVIVEMAGEPAAGEPPETAGEWPEESGAEGVMIKEWISTWRF